MRATLRRLQNQVPQTVFPPGSHVPSQHTARGHVGRLGVLVTLPLKNLRVPLHLLDQYKLLWGEGGSTQPQGEAALLCDVSMASEAPEAWPVQGPGLSQCPSPPDGLLPPTLCDTQAAVPALGTAPPFFTWPRAGGLSPWRVDGQPLRLLTAVSGA